jgi:hypothetical protein
MKVLLVLPAAEHLRFGRGALSDGSNGGVLFLP